MTIESIYPREAYTPQEQARILEFRSKVEDLNLSEEQLEDSELIRWLRARSLDCDKAYDMLKQSLEWRRENKIDGILERETVPPEVQKLTPFANLGLDGDGFPVLLAPVGRHDGRTLLEKYGSDLCLKYNTMNCERILKLLQNLSKEQGRPVTQFIEIIDLEGYNYRQLTSKLCRDFMIRIQTCFDSNYPELLRYCLVINAPKIFHILFNVLKPFIPKQTLEKIDIYGPEPEKWKKVIKERFPLELIPPHWGGTRKGSDEYCSKDDIWMWGPVPISFFKNGTFSDDDSTENLNLTSASINPRDSLKITVKVTKPKSCISWKFKSDSHDIGFQVQGPSGKVIVPFSRVQSQKQIQEGNHLCEKQEELGNYTVIFDNSYSLARSKTVMYNVYVIEPEIEVEENQEEEFAEALESPPSPTPPPSSNQTQTTVIKSNNSVLVA